MATDLKPPLSQNAVAILGRLIDPDDGSLNPEAARGILSLSFPLADRERVANLLERNQEGRLSEAERAELDEYLQADAFVSILKLKARRSLRRAGIEP